MGEKKTARCAFCCWVNSHPRRGTSYFQNTSANFLEKYFRRKPKETKYFRRKPKETKKLMADGLDAVLRLVQCSLGLDPLGERTSKVLAFTVVRGMLASACYLGVSVALTSSVALCVWVFCFFQCNICLHFFHLSADEVFPVDRGLVKSILSFPGTESWAWLQHSTVLWQKVSQTTCLIPLFYSFTPLFALSGWYSGLIWLLIWYYSRADSGRVPFCLQTKGLGPFHESSA